MKLEKIKKEIEKLPEGKKDLAKALYEKAEWQNAQLMDLQRHITENGWVEDYRNGEHQTGRKKSAEADTYLNLSKVFNSVVKQLNDIVSSVATETETDELTDFLKGKKMISR